MNWTDSLDVPFPHHGAADLEELAQFEPMDVLGALATQLRAHGGTLHQGRRVTGVSFAGSAGDDARGRHDPAFGARRARDRPPILHRGLHFSKVEA